MAKSTALTLKNGFSNWDNLYGHAYVSETIYDDQVQVTGTLRTPATLSEGLIIATLPTNLWPDRQLIFIVPALNGLVRVDVDTAGNLKYKNYNGTVPSNTWLSLDGIAFTPNV